MRPLNKDEFELLALNAEKQWREDWLRFYAYYYRLASDLLKMKPLEMFPAPELGTETLFSLDNFMTLIFQTRKYGDGICLVPINEVGPVWRNKYPGVAGAFWVAEVKDGKIIYAKPPVAEELMRLFRQNHWFVETGEMMN